MDIKLPKIRISNIIEKLKIYMAAIWLFLAISLLTYAGYIFYSKAHIPTTATPIPTIKPATVQKDKLNKILQDLADREKNRNAFSAEKIVSPFEFNQ